MPNPWILLGGVIAMLALLTGAFFYGEHVDSLEYKASIAKQEVVATGLLQQLTAEKAAKEALQAEAARNIDKVTSDAKEKAAADAAAAQSDFDQQLRRIAGRRPSCPSAGAPAAPNPGISQDAAAGERDRLFAEVARDFAQIGKSALDLAAYAKACHSFAISVGR